MALPQPTFHRRALRCSASRMVTFGRYSHPPTVVSRSRQVLWCLGRSFSARRRESLAYVKHNPAPPLQGGR